MPLVVLAPQWMWGQRLHLSPYQLITQQKDTVEAELGTFKVLEDRQGRRGDSITLAFVRLKSTNPHPGSPIVYLAGGPGGSGIQTARGARFELFMKLREVADVIAFDQRGTGRSNKLPACPYQAGFALQKPYDRQAYVDTSTTLIKRCQTFWAEKQIPLQAYHTTNSAYDLEDLRKALQVDKISLWGISYGSHLAFAYIRLFEEQVDKVVLASLEGPDHTVKLPIHTEQFIWHIAELAETNFGAEKAYPDLKEKIAAVHQRLEEGPVYHKYLKRRRVYDSIGISKFELQTAIATFYLKNPEDSKQLPQLYEQLYAEDYKRISQDVMVLKRLGLRDLDPMGLAMNLQSGISASRAQQVAQQMDTTLLGSSVNFLLFEWMANIDLPPLPDACRTLAPNRVDALLLSGTLDGRTYLPPAKEIAQQFKRGHHVVVEHAGHHVFMASPVIGDLMVDFYQGKPVEIERIELEPVTFD